MYIYDDITMNFDSPSVSEGDWRSKLMDAVVRNLRESQSHESKQHERGDCLSYSIVGKTKCCDDRIYFMVSKCSDCQIELRCARFYAITATKQFTLSSSHFGGDSRDEYNLQITASNILCLPVLQSNIARHYVTGDDVGYATINLSALSQTNRCSNHRRSDGTCKTSHGRLVQVVDGGGEVHRHLSSLMCLRSPNFRSEGSSHFDTIAATSFVNFPRRSRVNEGEARRVSMLRETSSFVFARTLQNLSRFWLGLFISVKILIFGDFQSGRHLLWTLCLWFLTVLDRIRFLGTYISRGSMRIQNTPTEFLSFMKFRYKFSWTLRIA